MNKRHFFKSLKKRLVLITLFFTLLTASLTASFGYISYRSILQDNLRQTTLGNLKFLAKTIQFDLDTAINLADICATNNTILNYLDTSNKENGSDSRLSYSAWKRLEEEYRNNRSNIHILRIIISDLSNNFIIYGSREGTTHSVPASRVIEESSFFDELYTSENLINIGFIADPLTPYSKNEQVLPIIKPISSFYGKEDAGWCCLFISPNLFINHMKNYDMEPDSNLYLFLGNTFYFWNGESLTETDAPETSKDLITYQPDDENWYLLQSISQVSLFKQTIVYMSTLLGLAAIVILLGFAITIYYHANINIPIQKIMKKLRLIAEGDFTPEPEIEWNNELGEIGYGINHMSQNIMQLIETQAADQKKKYELEYEILQNQLNPHFLYNTLNTISWMATMQGAKGIMEMTSSLSQLLKSVSKKTGVTHSLQEELTFLNHYFLILKYRYAGRLTLNTDIEEDILLEAIVPKFILQLVVENAVFHGIEPKGERGIIDIVIKSVNDKKDLLLSITDNGIGMTSQQIEKTLSHASSNSDLFRKIGIYNLQERIHYAYGTNYGISIESVSDKHTTVKILIPFKTEDHTNV